MLEENPSLIQRHLFSIINSNESKFHAVHESLAGRKRMFELSTVTLAEFINYRTSYKYQDRLAEDFRINKSEGQGLLLEYLNFGGYPRVVLEDTTKEKSAIIDEIYRSYIEKDIAYLLRVERIDAFGNLIRMLADRIGAMINLNELSSTVGISVQTVKNYLSYAEKTFIIRRVTPWFKNLRSEISKSPVMYFNDLGLRNFALRRFGGYTALHETGFLFQNLIHQLLVERAQGEGGTVHFWRTKDKAEVDFIINSSEGVIPVEVKCREMRGGEIGRSLRGFVTKYKSKEAWVVSLGAHKDEKLEKTRVRFIPFYELM